MTDRPYPLAVLLTMLWVAPRLWPPKTRERLLELRALALHYGLPCPAREHDVLCPTWRSLGALLAKVRAEGELRRALDLDWLLGLQVDDLRMAERDARGSTELLA